MPKQIVDPILTKVVQGFVKAENVGHELFPVVPVPKSGGKVLMFTDRDFKIHNTARSPGSGTKRIDVGYEGADYALENHSLEGKVPREHLRDSQLDSPTIKLEQRAVRKPITALALELEVKQAELARNPDNYQDEHKKVLSGTSQWSNPDSDPEADIKAGREAIRRQCGINPNKLVLSPTAFNALQVHPKILARMGTTVHGEAVTAEKLATLFQVKIVAVGEAIYYNEKTDETEDVWGNDAILAYVPADNELDREMPSYGYTYRMEGHPFVETKYYDENTKSWYYPTTDERKPVIAGITAGYLFKNAA